MKIVLDEGDAMTVAKAMAKSRGVDVDFDRPFAPDSAADKIWIEALRVVAALRNATSGLN